MCKLAALRFAEPQAATSIDAHFTAGPDDSREC